MLSKIKRKTYRNFLIVKNKLMREKGYLSEEASKITHMLFENFLYGDGRSLEWYYDQVLSAADYAAQFAR